MNRKPDFIVVVGIGLILFGCLVAIVSPFVSALPFVALLGFTVVAVASLFGAVRLIGYIANPNKRPTGPPPGDAP